MVASGLPRKNEDRHIAEISTMALELLKSVEHFRVRRTLCKILYKTLSKTLSETCTLKNAL